MRNLVVVGIVAACGPAATQAPIAQPPQAPVAVAVAKPTTCGDAGVILRGNVKDAKKAGPAKEAAIAHTCLYQKWNVEILACIGGAVNATAQKCLDKLDAPQRAAYSEQLAAWASQFEGETVADNHEADEGEVDGDPVDADVDCSSGIGDVATYAPALVVTGEERDFAVALRKAAVTEFCEGGWSNDVKRCFDDGTAASACRAQLTGPQQGEVTVKLGELDTLLGKIAATKKKAGFGCPQVVAVRYSDAAWKGKAELPKGANATKTEIAKAVADRKKAIASSRTLMTQACTSEKWSATLRACLVASGSDDCFVGAGQDGSRWGFPATGVVISTGIPECDVYAATNAKLLACDKFPQAAKDAIRQGFDSQRAVWLAASPAERAQLAAACKQAEEAIRQAGQSLGCTI